MLAAHRAGIGHVILPRRNEKDLKELPKGVKVSHHEDNDSMSYNETLRDEATCICYTLNNRKLT